MVTDLEIADALQRIAEKLVPDPPDTSWIVFIETQDFNGAPSYTYRMSTSYCDTAEIAIREAVSFLPRLEDGIRIRSAYAARRSLVTEFDLVRFRETQQFQVH